MSAEERGETSASIGSLYSICEVLCIPVVSLFETAPAPESNVVRRSDVRGVSFGGEGVENRTMRRRRWRCSSGCRPSTEVPATLSGKVP